MITFGGFFEAAAKCLYPTYRPSRAPARKCVVLLVDSDGGTSLCDVIFTQAGMMARRHDPLNSTICRLLDNGKVEGPSYVKSWLPFSGFAEEELMKFNNNRRPE